MDNPQSKPDSQAAGAGAPVSLAPERRRSLGADGMLLGASAASALLVLLMLGALVFVLFRAALPSMRTFGGSFLTRSDWRPNEIPARDARGKIIRDEDGETVMAPPSFGALPVIYGTAVSSVIALVVAVPLSLGAAIFLVRLAPRRLTAPISFMIEFLAAIPSIAYGLWGLFVLAPFLRKRIEPPLNSLLGALDATLNPLLGGVNHAAGWVGLHWNLSSHLATRGAPTGRDMLCGGLILGIMILPIITAVSRDVLKAVPRAQIEGALALGATWWQSAREMIRYSRSALFGAVMLGLARAAGETMAITMVIGNNTQINPSPLAPAQTMASLLANEFAEATGELHRSALLQVALILLAMSLLFNVIARSLVVGGQARTAAAH